jgi:hypothetical protein
MQAGGRYHGVPGSVYALDIRAMRLRAAIRAAERAREEAKLAYQFNPSSYSHGSLAQIELALVRLQEIEL